MSPLRGAFAPPAISKQKEDAKKWFDRTALDGYLSALSTRLVAERPADPQAFMLSHLLQHVTPSQLEEAGLQPCSMTSIADEGEEAVETQANGKAKSA